MPVPAATRLMSPVTGSRGGHQTLYSQLFIKIYIQLEGVAEVQHIVFGAAWRLAFRRRRAPAGGEATEERHSAPHPGEECGSVQVMLVQQQRDPPS